MIKNNKNSKVMFESVMDSLKNDIIRWLKGRYDNLAWQDAEDLVQDSCLELWKKIQGIPYPEEEIIRMWKVFTRNIYTHWVNKKRFSVDWKDEKLQYGWEERDYGWMQGDIQRTIKREMVLNYIDNMDSKEKRLMEMVLEKKKMDEISRELGYSNGAVVKNKKHKIITRMREKLLNDIRNEVMWLPAA